jgi:hypothetical protein
MCRQLTKAFNRRDSIPQPFFRHILEGPSSCLFRPKVCYSIYC